MQRVLVAVLFGSLAFFAVGVSQEIFLPQGASAVGLAWSPDGTELVVSYRMGREGAAECFAMPSGEGRWRTGGLGLLTPLCAPAFSHVGDVAAIGGQEGVWLLSAADGAILQRVEFEERFHPLAIAFRPDDGLAVVVEEVRGFPGSMYLELWDQAGNLRERRLLGKRHTPARQAKAAFSQDGRWLAFAAGTEEDPDGETWGVYLLDLEAGTLHSWDLRELLPDLPWEELWVAIAGVAVRPDGKEIAVGLYSADPGVPLVLRLDAGTGELIEAFYPSEDNSYVVDALTYSPDGALLAFAAYSPLRAAAPPALMVADLSGDEPALTALCRGGFPGECPFRGPTFSPDGRTLASLGWEAVRLWELCPEDLELPAPDWTFSFSSGGAYIPTGHGEWHVQVDAEGRFDVAHQVRDTVQTYGPFQLKLEEAVELWTLIQAAGIPGRGSSTRLGIPDEARQVFLLEGPHLQLPGGALGGGGAGG